MREAEHGPIDPELRELYNAVDTRLAVEAFLRTTVGQYLMRKADEERTDALADLVDVDAADQNRIRELQSQVKRADSIQMWLAEAVENGRNAEAQLNPSAARNPSLEDDE